MFEKIRNLKNKKGFTLVELIVVLVILAILAALLVPALTGYIDKANKEKNRCYNSSGCFSRPDRGFRGLWQSGCRNFCSL